MIEMILWIIGGMVTVVFYGRLTAVVAWWMAKDYNGKVKQPEPDEWILAGLFAMVLLPFLPVIFLFWLGRRWLLKPPESARLEMQRRRIRELERELDVR